MGKPSYQSGSHPVSWPCVNRWDFKNAGSITWAPVSPPAVVVLATRSIGCSWLRATRVTPRTATRLAQPGHADRLVRRRRSDGPLAGAPPTSDQPVGVA